MEKNRLVPIRLTLAYSKLQPLFAPLAILTKLPNLKQALEAGLRLKKIHKILEFDRSDWMRKYIELNTKWRQNAKNQFEKDFFKQMNNSVFERMMMNVRKHVNIKLVSDPEKIRN